jgi:hypothetical protein
MNLTKKLVSRIYFIVFFVMFFVMTALMLTGVFQQNKDEKAEAARYESLKTPGGKTVLTNEILEEDHDKFLEDVAENRKMGLKMLSLFGTVVVAFVLMAVFSLIIKTMEDGAKALPIVLISFIGVTFLLSMVILVTVRVLIPNFQNDRYKTDGYYFAELKLKDKEIEEKWEETGSGDDRRTEKKTYYYLIDENGNRISTNETYYDRFEEPGVYYAGQTTSGSIFSFYPGKYFTLDN